MSRHIAIAFLVLPLVCGGCMFHVEHRLPVEATFGSVRGEPAVRTPFDTTKVKRYILGGTIPWTLTYGHRDKHVKDNPGRRIEALEITTRFSLLDALLRFVPYVGYVLAQRTVETRGVYVDPVLETAVAQ